MTTTAISPDRERSPSMWEGVFAFPITPMNEAATDLDLDTYQRHLDRLLDAGIQGLVPLGSTGEFAYLSTEERKQVVATTVKHVAGQVPIIAGISAITTQDAVAYARQAEAVGADAGLVVLQSYFSLTPDQIIDHFRHIGEATSLPIFVYNNPQTSKHDLQIDTVERLLEIPNIVGLKESTGGLDRVMELQWAFGDRLILHCGYEHLAFPMFCLGVRGWSTATANLVPEQCVRLHRLAVELHDLEAARALHHSIAPLAKFLFRVPFPVAVKAGLALMGHSVGPPRPPLAPLQAGEVEELAGLLETAREA